MPKVLGGSFMFTAVLCYKKKEISGNKNKNIMINFFVLNGSSEGLTTWFKAQVEPGKDTNKKINKKAFYKIWATWLNSLLST